MNFVLDASVALNWLLANGTPATNAYAAKVLTAMTSDDTTGVAPVIWWLEIANVIAKAENKQAINEAQAESFLELLSGLGIAPDTATVGKALTDTLQIARRYRLSSYDASYLELALRAGLPLATLDDDLRKAAKKAGVARFAEA